jgi:hypothetical protein
MMLFTVELRDVDVTERIEVEINLDKQGLDDLLRQLTLLREGGDHVHFFTNSWGAGPLTEKKIDDKNVLCNHLRITLLENI